MEAPLFSCTKCNSRHPFEELSPGQQICKDCREASPVVKCTYCRTEFQESVKGSTSVCKKCDANVKRYGKPSACKYCNIITAFIGSKCQRCANSEKRYGPPVTCEQCNQRCAFDRKDESREKVHGKLFCCLCNLSYKRTLAEANWNSSSRHSSPISLNKSIHRHSENHKHPHSHSSKPLKENEQHNVSKKPRLETTKSTNGTLPTSDSTQLDPNISEHAVAAAELKDQIASLQKQLLLKARQALAKDKLVYELKAQHGVLERELRLKIHAMNKSHSEILEDLQSKNRVLQKQVVSLTKLTKKRARTDSPKRL